MTQENNIENTPLPPPPPPSGKRNLKVFALAIICIVLAASLVSVFVVYQPTTLQSQINEKDNTIKSLQQQIDSLSSSTPNSTIYIEQIASLQQQLSALNDSLTTANENAVALGNITTLGISEFLVYNQAVNPGTDAYNNGLYYAGYIVVQETSASNTTYVQTLYSSYGVNFNQTATLGTQGTATFPVLPGTVEVMIGNSNSSQSNETATVTIQYYF